MYLFILFCVCVYFLFQLKNYLERDWACKEEIRPIPVELSVWSLISYDGSAKATLDLGIFSTVKDQTVHMTVYCPFWMINNTGLLLAYKVRFESQLSQDEEKSPPSQCTMWRN
jgi:vacuolar protein sorting-associated protein 13A/C